MSPTCIVAVSAMFSTLVAVLIVRSEAQIPKTWIRWIFLVLLNLNPWTIGTWRSDFSKRETFMAAWFLTFILTMGGVILFLVCGKP